MRLRCFPSITGAALIAVLCLGPVSAPGLTYKLTVSAGRHDRHNTPVCVVLCESEVQANLNPVLLGKARGVTLTDSRGKRLPAQLTGPGLLEPVPPGVVVRELHFILPELRRGESLELKAELGPEAPAAEGFRWHDNAGMYAELRYGDRAVIRYMYEALDSSSPEARQRTYKVFHHLYDPAGTRLVTKGPGGLYSHHRGLFYGFNRISYADVARADLWGCSGGAYQSHEAFLSQEAGPVLGRHCVRIDWHGPDQRVFATERREMTVYAPAGGHLVEFASRLESTVGPVRLDGDPQHAGFQFRAAQEVADGDQKRTWFLRPDGRGKPGETRNWNKQNPDPRTVNLPWNAMSFVIGGVRYTAVYLDKPTNPKEARYSERSYGRFGSYFEYDLERDRPLVVNYRLWLQEGEMTVAQAAALSADFIEPPKVLVH
ncbi:MAG TPA: hypothetical protein EYP56_18290 [Planctomycetaceae bacterium]|nr:hypothetical protein [Planctomycetaceae bacterium]HIQ22358.1 hypothetical protein [Planctomycetota bacterium]